MNVKQEYIKELALLRRILEKRYKGTWIVVLTNTLEDEIYAKDLIIKEFPWFRFITLDLNELSEDEKIVRFIYFNLEKYGINFLHRPIETIVFLTGFDEVIEQKPHLLKQLNFERDSLFRRFRVVFIIFVSEKNKHKLKFQAPDFWDWLQYFVKISKQKDIKPKNRALIGELIADEEYQDLAKEKIGVKKDRKQINNILKATHEIELSDAPEERKNLALLNNYFLLHKEFLENGDYQSALEIALKALQLTEKIKDPIYTNKILLKIAQDYYHLKEFSKAKNILLSIKFNQIQDLTLRFKFMVQAAELSLDLMRPDKAAELALNALSLAKQNQRFDLIDNYSYEIKSLFKRLGLQAITVS